MPPKHPDIVRKLVAQAEKGRTFKSRPERLIQQIFARCFVDTSINLELIPDPLALILSGDGTPIYTGSSPFGIKVCNCRQHGIFRCSCMRRFPDPDANWGWDSYREVYYYGYTLYELIASASHSDLPMFLTMGQASRHDSVFGVVALAQFRELYPSLIVDKALWDSAHDVYEFYMLHDLWQIEPFIDLNSRRKGHFQHTPPVKVNAYGIPTCPNGQLMIFNGFDPDRSRLKWRCPAIAGNRSVKSKLSCSQACSPSSYGRTVYTKPHDDLRLFTKTPRNSSAWRSTYAKRTSSERSNKRAKIDYNLEQCKVKSKKAWFWRSYLVAMNQHLDAWVTQALANGFDVWAEILATSIAA